MATNQTSPLDATGRAAEKARKANAKELEKRSEEISTALAVEKELLENEVFDPSNQRQTVVLDEVETVGVSLANDFVVIRTMVDVEDMTYGVGTSYTFKAGVKYKVPRKLADYLERLGYIWRPN